MTAPDPQRAGARERPAPGAPRESAALWIRDHLEAVYRYARRRLPSADAEDVAQQAFAALAEAVAKGRAPDDAGAYLFGAARRRVSDLFRRRARRPDPVPLPDGWETFADRPLPPEVLEALELRDLVHVALGLLPESERSLLLARYREGASVAEIASRDGRTEKAVEMRLLRARDSFRARMRDVGRDWIDAPEATE
jgi:RNA polymerase sigma-70 factor (ECF subfamily)